MANINDCYSASGKQQEEHFDKTTPEVKGRLYKGIEKLDAALETGTDWIKDKTIDKIKIRKDVPISSTIENSNFNRDEKGILTTGNEVTDIVTKTFVTKQVTTNDNSHKGLLTSIVDNIMSKFRPFSKLDPAKYYDVQQSLITRKESKAMAFDSITRKLSYLYNKDGKVTSGDIQNMVNIALSGTIIDNYNNDMKMPMKKTIMENLEKTYGKEFLEEKLEEIKHSDAIKLYIKQQEDNIEKSKNLINEQNKRFRINVKQLDFLESEREKNNKLIKKEENDVAKELLLQKREKYNEDIKDLRKNQNAIEESNANLRQDIKQYTNKLSEESMQERYENELYVQSLIDIRKRFFGDKYVQMEMNDEQPSLSDISEDSELFKDKKLYQVYTDRIRLFENLKATLLNRAGEVLSDNQTRKLENALYRFDNYYKNVVNDVDIAKGNIDKGVNIKQGLKNATIGDYIQRMGTDKDIDNNILYIDTIALGQLQQQIIELDFIETIKGYDLNKGILETYQKVTQEELNKLIDRVVNNETTKQDKKFVKGLQHITREVRLLIANDPNVDQSLIDVIQDINDENLFSLVDGKQMNIFERMDYVFNKSIENLRNEFINNINKNVMKNFYNINPQYKEAIDYYIGNTTMEPNPSSIMSFLRAYSTTTYDGSFNAHNLYKMYIEKTKYKNAVQSQLKTNYKDILHAQLGENIKDEYVLTTNNGNPINYNIGNKIINQVNIGSMLDIKTIEEDAGETFTQIMAQLDSTYLDQLLQNQQIMILPKEVGDGLIESLTPSNDIGSASRMFNKWLRPLMILSPERILKFNLNTAFASDVYRLLQTNPKVFGNVKESIGIIHEYFKTGDVTNKVDPGTSVYNNKEKIFYEFRKLFGGQFDNEMKIINQKIASGAFDKLMKQIEVIESNERFSPKKKANDILRAYLDVVGNFTNAREMVLRLAYGLETAKEIDNGKPITYGASKRSQVDQLLEKGDNFKFIAGVSNQNFIAYKEAGNLARRMNRALFPFFLFPEGNVKWHYRLYENYMHELMDQNVSYQRKLQQTGKIGISLGIQLGLAQAIWNGLQRVAGFAPEDEDIPEYLRGNELPFDDLFESIGIKPNNYVQIGPMMFNKFNLAQDVMSFIPDFNNKTMQEGFVDYGKTWLGRVTPLIKTPFEVAMGGDYYQDGNMYPVNPKYSLKDNVLRKLTGLLGFTKTFEYGFDMAKNLPNEFQNNEDNFGQQLLGYASMMAQYQTNMVIANEKNAFDQTKNRFYTYTDEVLGKPYDPTPKYATDKDRIKNAIKLGLKYQDEDYLDKMVVTYYDYLIEEEGKTFNEANAQIQSLFRGQSLLYMGNISAANRQAFIQSLSVDEYEQYKKALNYERMIFGKYNYYLIK